MNLSREGSTRMVNLLDTAACSRKELIAHLVTLKYSVSPRGELLRASDGYITCPHRPIELSRFELPRSLTHRLEALARRHKLTPNKGSQRMSSMALDAILTGILVPATDGRFYDPPVDDPLLPPVKLHYTGRKHPQFMISRKARLGLERLTLREPDPSNPNAARDARVQSTPQLRKIILQLISYEFVLTSTNQTLTPYPRVKTIVSVPAAAVDRLAQVARQLGVHYATANRGPRSVLALASVALEAIGQGIITPSHFALGDADATPHEAEAEAIPA